MVGHARDRDRRLLLVAGVLLKDVDHMVDALDLLGAEVEAVGRDVEELPMRLRRCGKKDTQAAQSGQGLQDGAFRFHSVDAGKPEKLPHRPKPLSSSLSGALWMLLYNCNADGCSP